MEFLYDLLQFFLSGRCLDPKHVGVSARPIDGGIDALNGQ